jgi:hypothetical protein
MAGKVLAWGVATVRGRLKPSMVRGSEREARRLADLHLSPVQVVRVEVRVVPKRRRIK